MDFSFIEDAEVRATAEANYATEQETQKTATQKMIDEAVSGLKTKNEELIGEKRKIQETLKNFDDIDPKAAKEALAFLNDNEDAQMIKDGKISELIDKKTSSLRTEHENIVNELTEKYETTAEKKDRYKSLFEGKLLDDSLSKAAIAAKVVPSAIKDILLHGRNIFSVADDGSVEARDADGKILKTEDNKVLTPTEWMESQKKTSIHWWPPSESADFNPDMDGDDYSTALAKASQTSSASYRRLRKKRK